MNFDDTLKVLFIIGFCMATLGQFTRIGPFVFFGGTLVMSIGILVVILEFNKWFVRGIHD